MRTADSPLFVSRGRQRIMQMMKKWKDISAIPTSKPLVYSFTLFLMTMMAILLFRGRDIPPNIASLLSIVAPAIYGGYFLKSGYEHRVDRQYGFNYEEPRYPQMEETNDGSDEG
jgi:hypothetical protein